MPKKHLLILILGGPGAGKSTVSNIVQNNVKDSIHLKTGQIMRTVIINDQNISSKNKDEINNTMQHGGLVKDEIVSELLEKEMEHIVASNVASKFILDGFPRTISQLKHLLAKKQFDVNAVFILTAPHSIMEKRCKMRNLRTDRVDDRKGPVEHRINDYMHHVTEIRENLSSSNIPIIDIDTCDPMQKMTKNIEDHLKKLKLIE